VTQNLTVSQMTVDHAPTPRNAGPVASLFSWQLASDETDIEQVAYRIQVTRRPLGSATSDRRAVWDSGRVESAAMRDTPWARGHLDTPDGRIVCSWERTGDRVELTLDIPIGSRASVDLTDKQSVLGSGVHRFGAQLPKGARSR
jgi:hypothetical protein